MSLYSFFAEQHVADRAPAEVRPSPAGVLEEISRMQHDLKDALKRKVSQKAASEARLAMRALGATRSRWNLISAS